jgi:predicted DsbA family dithiol-disulfide isomerase
LREFAPEARLERRAFLLMPRTGERPVYDEYVISHRIAARRNAPDLPFAVPRLGQPYPSSSLPAQLLALYVRSHAPERVEPLEDTLLRAVFVELADTGDPSVLRSCATAAGVDPGAVDAALSDPELREQAFREHAEASSLGISGIPALYVPGQEPVVGAVPTDVYRATLARALGRPGPAVDARRRLPRA